MLETFIAQVCVIVAVICYGSIKIVDEVRHQRHRKNKMTKIERR